MWGPAVVIAMLLGVAGGLLARHVLVRLPAPVTASVPVAPDSTAAIGYGDVAAEAWLAVRISLIGALAGGVLASSLGWRPVLLPWLVLVVACPTLGYIDLRTRLLPTPIIRFAYLGVGALIAAVALIERSPDPLVRAGLGWVVMGGGYLLLWFASPSGLGYGDVRLAGVLALCLGCTGWAALVSGLYLGFVLGGLASLALLVSRRARLSTALPFGPFMMAGALLGVLTGPWLAAAMRGW